MGLYDPAFVRKNFTYTARDGEVPGSVVIGPKGRPKGCIWPANGKWFAATANHDTSKPYPSFDSDTAALEYVLAPLREIHEGKETARENAWKNAATKREARASKALEAEYRRTTKPKKGDKAWKVENNFGTVLFRVCRPNNLKAAEAAARCLGFSSLPKGYTVTEATA